MLSPIAGGDKGGPEEGMRALPVSAAIAQHAEAGVAHGIGGAEVPLQSTLVQGAHPETSPLVLDWPQAHDDGANARDLEGTAQPEYALASLYLSEPCVARREHGPLDAVQIERGDLRRSECHPRRQVQRRRGGLRPRAQVRPAAAGCRSIPVWAGFSVSWSDPPTERVPVGSVSDLFRGRIRARDMEHAVPRRLALEGALVGVAAFEDLRR